MYTQYFGLNENPFSIAPDPHYLYLSEDHREALAHLEYGIKSAGGFVVLTGEVGTGKTTLCRTLLEQLPDDVDVAFILNPKVSVIELLETICDELLIKRPEKASIKQLVDLLNAHLLDANARRRKTLLIIDEAQNLAVDVLEQLRLLTNLETTRYKLLQVILLGQPELNTILGRQDLRQLSQRVTARFHLGPLAAHEVGPYVKHRLQVAGGSHALFAERTDRLIWQLTGGVPRLINLICDRALLGAYARELGQVDSSLLKQAAHEVIGRSSSQRKEHVPLIVVLAVVVGLLVAAAGFWQRQQGPVSADMHVGQVETLTAQPKTPAPRPSAQRTTEPMMTVRSDWPVAFAVDQERHEAFNDLLRLWGVEAVSRRADYCSYAREHGLQCLAGKGSLELLASFNRPVLLTLYADEGQPFYVVMNGLRQNSASFVAGAEQHDISLSALARRWFGDYLLLWQPPANVQQLLRPGEQGPAVTWLAKMLDALDLYRQTGKEKRLDGLLLGALKEFQFANGLTPDGVLGPMTMIQLGRALNASGPRLQQQGVG